MSWATAFLLFWLHLDTQSFKILKKLYLSHPALLLVVVMQETDLKISCYLTSGFFLLFINDYCWSEHVIPWAGKESYWSNFYLSS